MVTMRPRTRSLSGARGKAISECSSAARLEAQPPVSFGCRFVVFAYITQEPERPLTYSWTEDTKKQPTNLCVNVIKETLHTLIQKHHTQPRASKSRRTSNLVPWERIWLKKRLPFRVKTRGSLIHHIFMLHYLLLILSVETCHSLWSKLFQ